MNTIKNLEIQNISPEKEPQKDSYSKISAQQNKTFNAIEETKENKSNLIKVSIKGNEKFVQKTQIEELELFKKECNGIYKLQELLDEDGTTIDEYGNISLGCEELFVSESNISKIPELFNKLKHLCCSNCRRLKELPTTFTQLTYLDCSHSPIQEIPKGLYNLQKLNCSWCPIHEIPKELIQLTELICRSCYSLAKIPKELTKLQKLDIGNCSTQKLPKELINLQNLDCSGSRLDEIPKTFTQLTVLNCIQCPLKQLPKELIKLQSLECVACPIQEIPKEFTQLLHLNCSNCHYLKQLPNTLTQLIYLLCNNCPIHEIPSTFTQIKELGCSHSFVQRIPNTCTQLKKLSCFHCPHLSEVPHSLLQLKEMECHQTILYKHNFKNSFIDTIGIFSNLINGISLYISSKKLPMPTTKGFNISLFTNNRTENQSKEIMRNLEYDLKSTNAINAFLNYLKHIPEIYNGETDEQKLLELKNTLIKIRELLKNNNTPIENLKLLNNILAS